MFVSVWSLVLGLFAAAQLTGAPRPAVVPYYGEQFYQQVRGREGNDVIKQAIRTVLNSDHRVNPGRMDDVVASCAGQQGCYRHTNVGYDRARQFLLGSYYLVRLGNLFGVRDVYCEKVYGPDDFRARRPGPNIIPADNVVNTEHTWPQSRFSKKYAQDLQKADMHHLFPTDSAMNSIRSSFEFGPVVRPSAPLKCPQSRFGAGVTGAPVFEPPAAHRGNVARALFYFSVRYELPISPAQEAALRQWNKEDPVDADELNRNNEIYKLQGSRNPFVDHPELADRIADF